jgi:putative ABC transport system permease protein
MARERSKAMPRMTTVKAVRDLLRERSRTALALAAIAIGVIAAGASLASYSILTRELAANYLASNPASASLWTAEIPVEVMTDLKKLPEVRDAETRDRITVRLKTGDNQWKNMWIYVIPDFTAERIAKLVPQSGAWPPGAEEILFERQSFKVAPIPVGSEIEVRSADGTQARLLLSGTLHDIGTAPAWMENLVYGYVTEATARRIGIIPDQRELKIVSSGDAMDRENNRAVTVGVASWLSARGIDVYQTEVPIPGRHVHADQMESLLFLQEGLGILALALSCFLVITLISSLLARQVRQIAVMKAIGGSTASIRMIYVRMVLALGIAAFAIGAPLGQLLGRLIAYAMADTLNFTITNAAAPAYVLLLQAAVSMVLTLAAAAVPVMRGTSRSVRDSLTDYGIPDRQPLGGLLSRFLSLLFSGDRPMLLSVRNVFRRKARFIRALLALAVGGAAFMTGMNLGSSIAANTGAYFDCLKYDIGISLGAAHPLAKIGQTLKAVPGVSGFDYGIDAKIQVVHGDGSLGVLSRCSAVPLPSSSLALPQVSGRWLAPDDAHSAVINTRLLEAEPDLRVGGLLRLASSGSETEWKIVGVVSEITMPGLYVPYESLPPAMRGTANAVRVLLEDRGNLAGEEAKKRIESAFSTAGIEIGSQLSMREMKKIIDDHLVIITVFLTSMSVFMILVGMLGLTSAMSVGAMERRREIGVMRAIGAAPGRVMALVMSEGLVTSALSWIVGIVLSLPLSAFLAFGLGTMLLNIPLGLAVNPWGIAIWLAVTIVIGGASGFFPALSASRASVREALTYE